MDEKPVPPPRERGYVLRPPVLITSVTLQANLSGVHITILISQLRKLRLRGHTASKWYS